MPKKSCQYFQSKLKLLSWLVLIEGIGFALVQPCLAQSNIVPDTTLGVESSQVITNTNDLSRQEIIGGAQRGITLFHSFQEFNINEGNAVFFNNPAGIENILGRVTGNNPSNILGKLGVLGDANLFLLNPNGIIFGENASLDINGSFVATSANAIQFGEQGFFSADDSNSLPLLTINPSAFFFNQMTAGAIQNQSTVGLSVAKGNSLLLLGGDVELNGGRLNALGGQIEIGGLKDSGTVGLNIDDNSFKLSFPDRIPRGNVSLSNQARVNVSSDGGGSIAINANNLNLSENSNLVAGIASGLGTPNIQAGDITVNATDTINLSQESFIANEIQPNSIGNSGDIKINSRFLFVKDTSFISSTIFGRGDAGLISINVSEKVEFLAEFAEEGFIQNLTSDILGEGNSQGIEISTGSLLLKDGAGIYSDLLGQGNAGLIYINASEKIELIESSFISKSIAGDAEGNGAGLKIDTGSLLMKDGGVIRNTLFGSEQIGPAQGGLISIDVSEKIEISGIFSGFSAFIISRSPQRTASELVINTGSLSLNDGAQIINIVAEQGKGSLVSINASEKIELSGTETTIVNDAVNTDGGSGRLEIKTGSLFLRDGASISSSVLGEGREGNGGNIDLEIADLLFLSNNSSIATQVGREDAGGNGGNIIIKANFVVASPEENNDITANAFNGSGGKIEISTTGIFGLEERSSNPPNQTNDIDASSQFGLDGEIVINQLDINPAQGLEELPTDIIDVTNLVAQGCPADNRGTDAKQSQFILTGRGGLPPQPEETLRIPAIVIEDDNLANYQQKRPKVTDNHIIEANSWIINAEGKVVLTASVSPIPAHSYWSNLAKCS